MDTWRPPIPASLIDFEASRFVVVAGSGLVIGRQKYEQGDEVPRGALDTDTLREQYEPPLRLIELFDIAVQDPEIREACARRGTLPDPEDSDEMFVAEEVDQASQSDSSSQPVTLDLDNLSRQQLVRLCERYDLSTNGSKQQLKQRILESLA